MLKLKLQYFGHLMRRADSLEKTLMLGKMEGGRRGGQEEMVGWHHWLSGHVFEYTLGAGEGQGRCCFWFWQVMWIKFFHSKDDVQKAILFRDTFVPVPCRLYLSLICTHNKNHVNSDPTRLEVLVMVMRARLASPIFFLSLCFGRSWPYTPLPIQYPGWRSRCLC